MAPDQTSRVMGNKFDIRDGNSEAFQYFSKRFSLQGWKFLTVLKFSNEIALQRMGISTVSKFSNFIPLSKDGSPRLFKIFQLYSCK
jgi:hypothetical protein